MNLLKRVTPFIIIVVLALAIPPAVAQAQDAPEATPEIIASMTDTGTDIIVIPNPGTPIPDENNNIALPYLAGMLLLVIVAFLYSAYENHSNRKLHLEAVDRLYNSTPALVRQPAYEFVTGTGDNILEEIDALVNATSFTDLDNQAAAQMREWWGEIKTRWQDRSRGGVFPPVKSVTPKRTTPSFDSDELEG